MEDQSQTVNPVKKFVKKHKTAIVAGVGASAVTVTAFVATTLWVAVGFYNDFLEEKDLREEFQEFMDQK